MWVYAVKDDVFRKAGETDKLGWPYDPEVEDQTCLSEAPSLFPWTRCCLSIGDWGIISALPRLLSEKYPGIQFELPTSEWLRHAMGPGYKKWNYGQLDSSNNINLIFDNNPYVSRRFNIGEYDSVICDHIRCYRYDNEPLVEKILRAFGFTEDEILEADTRPELYFSEEEIEIGESVIQKYVGTSEFGTLLLASRLEKFNKLWPDNFDRRLISDLKSSLTDYSADYPVFYYSTSVIEGTKWEIFTDHINFLDIPECKDLRIQLYIKSRAKFNTGYQAGITDSIGGGLSKDTWNYYATPYDTMKDNVVRQSYVYYFQDGSKTMY